MSLRIMGWILFFGGLLVVVISSPITSAGALTGLIIMAGGIFLTIVASVASFFARKRPSEPQERK